MKGLGFRVGVLGLGFGANKAFGGFRILGFRSQFSWRSPCIVRIAVHGGLYST